MPALRGSGPGTNWGEVILSPYVVGASLRKETKDRARPGANGQKFPRASRFFILLAGIVMSWTILFALVRFIF